MVASTGTAAALTNEEIFRLKVGDEAKYGKVTCEATNVAPYSALDCRASGLSPGGRFGQRARRPAHASGNWPGGRAALVIRRPLKLLVDPSLRDIG
jgi:hypothetical protein